MNKSIFRFKQFSIDQTLSPFKVGTDGVLAGALCQPENAETILDVGTGTGLIALMLAQKSNAKIDALEIEKQAFQQAVANFNNSPWTEKLTGICTSFQSYSDTASRQYDLIVSNPPFFDNSKKSDIEVKNIARHNDLLKQDELLAGAQKLLSPNGTFSVIYPLQMGELFVKKAEHRRFYCSRKMYIFGTPGSPPKRLYLEFSLIPKPPVTQELVIEETGRHLYSKAYIELTKEYYLNF